MPQGKLLMDFCKHNDNFAACKHLDEQALPS